MKEFALSLYSYFLIIGFSATQPSLSSIVPSASVVPCASSLAGRENCWLKQRKVHAKFIFCFYLPPLTNLCVGDGDTLQDTVKLVK